MATIFYRNREDDGTVNLIRVNNDVMMPTGKFCCVVPDGTSTNVTVCANIGYHNNGTIRICLIQVVLLYNSPCVTSNYYHINTRYIFVLINNCSGYYMHVVVFAHVGIIIDQSVTFQLTSSLDSIDVSFSLICNSTGGPVTSLIWRRDGFSLDNSGPLVLTDASIDSYTNVLHVNNRTTEDYTCLSRGPSDEVLNSTVFNVQGSNYLDS